MTDTPNEAGVSTVSAPASRISIPIQLRWGDLDAYNHVNNTSMLKLLEEARVRAFWAPDEGEEAPPTAVLQAGIASGTLSLIARQEIEYLAPVPYQRRPLDVQLWFGKIGGSSVDVCYEVFNDPANATRVLYARSTAVLVLVNADTGRPTRVTAEMREAWAPYIDKPNTYAHR
ncbi:acyl-CoA thioesterase [Microbacterium sp. A84]|uniref:acyl-CoA thioesterase n=1 Tax=Microbacterium sp. A84 TaxID=3450715 RepID=UPI003F41C1BB